MVSELTLMQLSSDQKKIQVHDTPLFPCSGYFTNWKTGGIDGVPWHWHHELEFLTVASGNAVADFGSQTAYLHTGDGLFCNSDVLHRIRMKDCSACQIHSFVVDAQMLSGGHGTIFEWKYLRPVLSSHSFYGTALYQTDDTQREIIRHIRDAHRFCRDEPFGYEIDVRYHLGKTLTLILQHFDEAFHNETESARNLQMLRVQTMLEYIHDHYADSIAISDLAASAGICEREVQRCFQNVLKQTPREYILTYRIQAAIKMLLETNNSVLDIGIQCGFSNPSHFSRVFHGFTHSSPRKFREINKTTKDELIRSVQADEHKEDVLL